MMEGDMSNGFNMPEEKTPGERISGWRVRGWNLNSF